VTERILNAGLILFIAANTTAMLLAQPPQASPATADVLQKIDQLIEQNHNLEQQNRALMEEINALRQSLSSQGGAPLPAPAGSTSSAAQSNTVVSPSTDQSNEENDDKQKLPEASNGNAAVFGEFNPGRGFTVGKSEYGTLNLSGYMAVRYLNQLPPDQSGLDHLGRPIPVMPRDDYQFHRVMLFSQGWLFTPKFQYSTFLWTVQDTNQVAVGGALTTTSANT
jgi:hypothetical protein